MGKTFIRAVAVWAALTPLAWACTLHFEVAHQVQPPGTLILPSLASSVAADRERPVGLIHLFGDKYQTVGPPEADDFQAEWIAAGAGLTRCNIQGATQFTGGDWWCEVEHPASGDYTATFRVVNRWYLGGTKIDECAQDLSFSYHYDAEAPTLSWDPEPAGILSSTATFVISAQDETALSVLEVTGGALPYFQGNEESDVPGPFLQNTHSYHRLAGPMRMASTVTLSGLVGAVTVSARTQDYGVVKTPPPAGRLSYDWHQVLDSRSFTVDGEAPTVQVKPPPVALNGAALAAVTGTAADDTGVSKVTLTVQDEATGKWWDGSAFTASETVLTVFEGAQTPVEWSYAGLSAAVLPLQGATWRLRAEATDSVGRKADAVAELRILPAATIRQRLGWEHEAGCAGEGRPATNPLTGLVNMAKKALGLPPGSPGLDLAVAYDAKGPAGSAWGRGWVSPHDQSLLLKSGKAVLWTDGSGNQRHYFPPPGGGDDYAAPEQSFTKMTVTARDARGWPTALTLREKDGTTTLFALAEDTATLRPATLSDRNGNSLAYRRDGAGKLTRLSDVHGRYLQLAYADDRVSRVDDSAGRFATYAYDANGAKTSETAPNGTTGFVYDAQARLSRVNYPNGGFRALSYDAQGRVTLEESDNAEETLAYEYFPSSTVVTDALNRKTAYDFTEQNGLRRATRILDPANKAVSLEYDATMNLKRQVDDRLGVPRVTEFLYDAGGNVTQVKDPASGLTDIVYDPVFNQPTSIQDPNRNPPTTLGYNAQNGNLESVTTIVNGQPLTTNLAYDGQGHVTGITDPRGKTTTFEYDANGQLARVQDPVHPATVLTRDPAGRVTSQRDPKTGLFTTFSYDPDGSLTEVTDALNGHTLYDYTPGRESRLLAKVTDARQTAPGSGLGTSFGYDALGRLRSVAAPGSAARTFLYNEDGALKEATNARNQTAGLSYDGKGRLTGKTAPEGAFTYAYDDADRQTLIQTPDGSKVERTYDALDRVVTSRQTYPDGYSVTLSYDYDANGNKRHAMTPWGTFTYDYDALNRLKAVTDPEGKAFSFAYDPAGRRTALIRSIPLETRYGYDDAGQLTSIRHVRTSDQVEISSAGYRYDDAGNRDRLFVKEGTHTYLYDDLHRLTEAAHPSASALPNGRETFAYDAVGNRTADQGVTGYLYDAANRIQENSLYAYAHDADGNVTRRTAKDWVEDVTLAYDSENQLKRVDLPGGAHADFAYDGLGRRLEKGLTSGLGTQRRRYVYDGEDILAVLNPDDGNSLVALFTHGPGIDEPLKMNGPQGELFFLADGLGSIVGVTDVSGNLLERVEYEAYGKPVFADLRGPSPVYGGQSWTQSPYAFTAREWDAETGLYFYRARYYEPTAGRFLQDDALLLSGKLNSGYVYAQQRPISFVDPLGTAIIAFTHSANLVAGAGQGLLLDADQSVGLYLNPRGAGVGHAIGVAASAGTNSLITGTELPNAATIGVAGGWSAGILFSTAENFIALEGPFKAVQWNLGPISLQYATDGKVRALALTGGPFGEGLSFSRFVSYTPRAAIRQWPILPPRCGTEK